MSNKPIVSTFVDIDIPFFDCDAMHIVWHGHYVKYLEIARCALFDKIDFNYLQMHKSGYIWPIVDMRVKYVNSVSFGDKITIQADLVEMESRLKINYLIIDKKTQTKITKAYTIQVAITEATRDMQFVTPKIFSHKVNQYLANEA